MFIDNYDFLGMHFGWWVFWVVFLLWIFATSYKFSRKRKKIDTPFDLLDKRLASGEISKDEYQEMKSILGG